MTSSALKGKATGAKRAAAPKAAPKPAAKAKTPGEIHSAVQRALLEFGDCNHVKIHHTHT